MWALVREQWLQGAHYVNGNNQPLLFCFLIEKKQKLMFRSKYTVQLLRLSERCKEVKFGACVLEDMYLDIIHSLFISAQPAGQPEISRMSLDASPVSGGQDLFVIGKNFNKGFKVKFQQVEGDDTVLWEQEAKVDQEFTQLVGIQTDALNKQITSTVQPYFSLRLYEYIYGGYAEPPIVD